MSSRTKKSKPQPQQPSLPKREPYKFMTRSPTISQSSFKGFKEIRVKRLYLKHLTDWNDYSLDKDEILYRSFKNSKAFTTLRLAQLPYASRSYVHESLKNAKSLKSFCITGYYSHLNLAQLALYVKKLPVHIKRIQLFPENHKKVFPNQDIYKIAKLIRTFPKLQYFNRGLELDLNEKHVSKELKTYSDAASASRQKHLKVIYNVGKKEQSGFQRAMRRGIICPGITGLTLNLAPEGFHTYDQVGDFLEEEESQYSDVILDFENLDSEHERAYRAVEHDLRNDDEEERDDLEGVIIGDPKENNDNEEESLEVDEDFMVDSIMREEMKPFYRFELFPDLKILSMYQEDCLYPLGSFVVDGFAALTKIEDLSLVMLSRSLGSSYIFKGLLQLPLLRKFALEINFIKKGEWVLFEKFLKKQNNLESFLFRVINKPHNKPRYIEQKASIQKIIKCLDKKPLLTSLKIGSVFWSLETLSQGFAHLKMKNQLRHLKIEASDECITTNTKSRKRVEGICNFIKNQKDSLKKLEISLPLVLEDAIVTHLAEAISKATSITSLYLWVNSFHENEIEELRSYFEDILQRGVPKKSRMQLKSAKTWNPSLVKNLKRLENLEVLLLEFDILHDNSTRWFLDLFKALPSFEKLKYVNFKSKSGAAFCRFEEKMIETVLQLKNIKTLIMDYFDYFDIWRSLLQNLEYEADLFNEKQSLRCDLMF